MESPVDHTSAVMVYSLPVMRSGWGGVARCKHGQRVEESQCKNSHRHVLGRASESARTRADELARNAKVTKFDYALAREEDIRRFDVSVDDFLGVQVRKALQDLSNRFPDNTQITSQIDRCEIENKGGGAKGARHTTHPLRQDPGNLLPHAALPAPDLLPDGSQALPLAQLHHQLDLAVRRGHVRAIKPDDVRVPQAREERELPHKLLQRALMRDDRLAREPAARPLVLHSLHRAARALPKQRGDLQHAVRPHAVVSRRIVRPHGHRRGRRRRGRLHAAHELPQVAQGDDFRDGARRDR